MNVEERVQLVRLLVAHLGDDDNTDRHVIMDKVEGESFPTDFEGCITELSLSVVAAVAIDSMDCRLIFLNKERNTQIDHLVDSGFALYMNIH